MHEAKHPSRPQKRRRLSAIRTPTFPIFYHPLSLLSLCTGPVITRSRNRPVRVMSASTALASASKLGDLLAQLPLNPPNQWPQIELTAQSLANSLRSKDGSLPPLCFLLACSMPTRAP